MNNMTVVSKSRLNIARLPIRPELDFGSFFSVFTTVNKNRIMAMNAMRTALQRLGFTVPAAHAITDDQGMDSLDELRILEDSDVENLCKVVRRPGGTVPGADADAPAVPNPGISVSLRAENNLKLAAFWLRHRWRISRATAPQDVTIANIRSVLQLRNTEDSYKHEETLPMINARDWPKTMDAITEYLRTRLGERMIPLAYVIRDDVEVIASVDDPPTNYDSPIDEMIRRAPHGMMNNVGEWIPDPVFIANREKVWDIIAQITRDQPCWTYVKPAQRTRDGRAAFLGLYNHFLGPNNVDNMASKAEKTLEATTYKGESRRWNFERYVNLQMQQHSILEGLVAHGYAGIDERSKVRHLLAGIKTDKLDAIKTRIMSDTKYRNSFDDSVTLYMDFIKESTPATEVPTRQVSVVAGDKRKRTDGVEDRYYTKTEYAALSAEQKRALSLKRQKRGHKPGERTSTVQGKTKDSTAKSIKAVTRTVAQLAKKVENLVSDETQSIDDSVESTPTGTRETGNRTNKALTRQQRRKNAEKNDE